jgi:hypothetical protein
MVVAETAELSAYGLTVSKPLLIKDMTSLTYPLMTRWYMGGSQFRDTSTRATIGGPSVQGLTERHYKLAVCLIIGSRKHDIDKLDDAMTDWIERVYDTYLKHQQLGGIVQKVELTENVAENIALQDGEHFGLRWLATVVTRPRTTILP